MNSKKLCCGIDVSHTTLDICYQNNLGELFHLQVGNNNKGFATIMEHTGTDYHFVMERLREFITYGWPFFCIIKAAN